MKHAHEPYTHGRIRLRLLAEADLQATLAWRNRDGAREQFKHSDLLAYEQHHGWFVRYCDKPDDLVFVAELAATGERVGQVAIYAIDGGARTAEIGRFVAAPEFLGQGLMKEAIDVLMRFAARELSLASVYLEVLESNERASHLYRKLGFEERGRADGLIRMDRSIDDYL
ncbi:GNAT family N-acetyltransferase [Burkholderia sp. Ac-20353]|uniref:GNAT family N-acetyltransferase n=1 Tax=Burkholderia sp. Ac-20353 TaxID=2703894 RepID=UPI00197CA322|nr:GNAT family N-acetyltransferase [Burkholderia sp. Ac-20353]MBN3789895.1 GNAT family N-acetyltransferase [Burkholderia sp. Ac-20353]